MIDLSNLRTAYDGNPVGFLLLEALRKESLLLRYGNRAAAALAGRTEAELAGWEFPCPDGKDGPTWLQLCRKTAAEGGARTIVDYVAEFGRYLQLDCFQYAPGFCGCVLREAEGRPVRPGRGSGGRPGGMSRTEASISKLIRHYAIPFGELYFLRDKEDFVYLSDPDTYEMLYISAEDVAEILPHCKDYRGKKCYEVLQDRKEPCPFCTNGLLRFDQYHIWQHRNEVTGREYLLRDKLTRWNGRAARMEVVMDVTDAGRKNQLLTESLESRNLFMSCSAALNDGTPLHAAMERVLSAICRYFRADSGVGILFDEPHICTVWPSGGAYRVGTEAEYPSEAAVLEWSELLRGKGQVMLPDVEETEADPTLKAYWRERGVRSLAMTPVILEDRLCGYLELHNLSDNLSQIATLDMIVGAVVQAVQQAALQEENQRLQYRDPLTGALNFEGFKKCAARALLQNADRAYAVWYFDVKRFKYINDVFGYEAGDRLLRRCAQVIGGDMRDGELFGRISGDNLTALTCCESPEALERRFARWAREIETYLDRPEQRLSVELMAGIYLRRPDETLQPDINQMLDLANVAQKSVKELSGSRLAWFTEDMWQRQLRELKISQHMPEALANREFLVWFQPQYNYVSGKLIGAEALVRWKHPELGWLSPAEFIPILERGGQIPKLDRYVWEESCRYMRRWLDADGTLMPVSLSVNVSRVDIRGEGLCGQLCALVERFRLPPEMLRLEITESAYMEEPEQLIAVAGRLRELGFTVEMDDFGSGYSSLNTLKDVPVDILKLDMKFLGDTDNTFRGGNILSSVVRMAHWLELPVIAEGVETREQADYLKSLGCYLMQGYYFAKPMPPEDFEKLLCALPLEHIEHKYQGVGLLNMAEFLDTKSKSSFLFNDCIGGAVLLEFDGANTEALMLNDAFYEAVGVGRADYDPFRMHMVDAIHPDDRNMALRTLDEAVAAGKADCEMRMAQIAGARTERWIHASFRRLSSGGGRHILFTQVEDVTRQHEMRAELNRVTTELSSYLELMPGGVFRYAADDGGQFDYVSPGLLELLGYSQRQFEARFHNRFPEMVYEGDRERVLREIEEQIAVGDTDYCEYRVETADGTLKWVYDVGRLVTDAQGRRWFYVVVTDIDAQKRAQNNLLFETYGKSIAVVFDEVIDVDYGSDTSVVLHARCGERVGAQLHGVAAETAHWARDHGLSGAELEKYRKFAGEAHLAEAFLASRVEAVELQTDDGRWYKDLLLPLSETRGLFCVTAITAEKRAEQVLVESARLEAVQDLLSSLPVGACMFALRADGGRELQFVSQTACRIFHTTQERLAAVFNGPDAGPYLPYPEDPQELAQLLESGRPYERQISVRMDGAACEATVLTNLVRRPDGAVTGYTAVLDASEKVQAEHRQLWQQTLYRILTELPMLVAFDYDPLEDRMTCCINTSDRGTEETVVEHYLEHLDRRDRLAPDGIGELKQVIREALRKPTSGVVDFRADFFGLGYRWSRARYASLADQDGAVYRAVGRVDDIEEERQREQTLRELAQRDAMTGFLNHDASKRGIESAIRAHKGGALLIVDIDDFKRVNDLLGHLFGDTFLQVSADAIRELFRKEDLLGRFGGDEFVIFLPGVYNEQLARRRAEEVLRAVERIEVPELGRVRCSVGIAIADGGDVTLDALFQRADFALYEAKRGGKGNYAVYRGGRAVDRMPEPGPRLAPENMASDVRPQVLAGDVFSILYHADATAAGIRDAMAHIGRWLDVSRVYLFENATDDSYFVNTFEWCGDGVSPEIGRLQHVEICTDGADYYDNFDRDDIFYCPDVAALPQWQRELLAAQDVRAMLQYAFRENGRIRGFVGFDECRDHRLWVKSQVDSLVRTAEVLSVFLQRLRGRQPRPTA